MAMSSNFTLHSEAYRRSAPPPVRNSLLPVLMDYLSISRTNYIPPLFICFGRPRRLFYCRCGHFFAHHLDEYLAVVDVKEVWLFVAIPFDVSAPCVLVITWFAVL